MRDAILPNEKIRRVSKVNVSAILFLSIPLLLYFVFYLLPALTSVVLSFTKWDGLTAPVFVGFQNFSKIFRDPRFLNSVLVNIKVVVISLFTQLPLALLLAYLLVKQLKGTAFFRAVLFIPQMLSLVAVGVLWSLIYHPTNGPLAKIFEEMGMESINWLGSTSISLLSLMVTTTWVYFGFHMVLQIAGMSSIPQELYDSAKLDTDNSLEVFFRVTLPLLRETLLISTVMIISGSFSHLIGLFWVMTRGGPMQSTELISIYIYKSAFSAHQFGYSSAMTVIMVAFIAAIVGVVVWQFSKVRIEF